MVNLIYENKQKESFKEFIIKNSKSKNFKFNINTKNQNLIFIPKSNSKLDLTKLIECSKNYYEDILKVYNVEEKVIELDTNTILDISGFSIIYIIIKKDLKLTLNFSSKNNNSIFIKILIKEDTNLILEENLKSTQSYIFTNLVIEKNSKVKHGKILNKGKISHLNSYIGENSSYELIVSYFLDNQICYMKNSSYLKNKNSSCNILVNGAVINNSNLINDGIINISKTASDSSGHQKLNNLILDKTSKIISEPILEINNNDVLCSHGCTISQISEEIDFYSHSRGLNKTQVIELFLEGFNNLVYEHTNKNIPY